MNLITPFLLAFFLFGMSLSGPESNLPCSALEAHYADMNDEAILKLHERATTRLDRFLALYRLVPITKDVSILDDLPHDLEPDAPAREKALLSALWAFQIPDANWINKIVFARRGGALLKEAWDEDPDDPYVMLVGAQSLLFSPPIVGGSATKALDRFRELRALLAVQPVCGISVLEVDCWIWLTLKKLEDPEADRLYADLMARDLPAFYRGFLQAPP